MYIKVVCIGKIKEKFYMELIDEYIGKIKKYNSMEIVQLEDEAIPKKTNDKINSNILYNEGERVLKKINDDEYVIGLCIAGKEINHKEHSKLVSKVSNDGYNKITYVIGGSLGTSENVRKRMNYKLSFSKMTFPHQLMRVVLLEEISRTNYL